MIKIDSIMHEHEHGHEILYNEVLKLLINRVEEANNGEHKIIEICCSCADFIKKGCCLHFYQFL